MAVVRYIVSEVSAAIPFYTEQLGFELKINPAPGFAMLARDDLRLLLNASGAGGAGTSADPSGNVVDLFEPPADRRA